MALEYLGYAIYSIRILLRLARYAGRRSGALSKNLARAADAVKVVYVSRPLIRLPDKACVRQPQRDGNERELARNRSASNSDTIAFTLLRASHLSRVDCLLEEIAN